MVITFILGSSDETAKLLDKRRLNKQIIEAGQIIKAIEGVYDSTKAWSKHPAKLMWEGYTPALKNYYNSMVKEWYKRGGKGSYICFDIKDIILPWWWNWDKLIFSHKLALYRKDPVYYGRLFDLTAEEHSLRFTIGYLWPTKVINKFNDNCNISDLCDPLGTGCPPQYFYSYDEIKTWKLNPMVNPKTGAKLRSTNGNIYKRLSKANKWYENNSSTCPL